MLKYYLNQRVNHSLSLQVDPHQTPSESLQIKLMFYRMEILPFKEPWTVWHHHQLLSTLIDDYT